MLNGKCLCGAVRYQLNGELLYLYHCHCTQCRTFSGASFDTNASILGSAFKLIDPKKDCRPTQPTQGRAIFAINAPVPFIAITASTLNY